MRRGAAALCVIAAVAAGCKSDAKKATAKKTPPGAAADAAAPPADAAPPRRVELPPPPPLPERPRALPRPPARGREVTAARVALGEKLFVDDGVWGGERGCTSCHDPAHGFSSATPLPRTEGGEVNLRHPPPLWNATYYRSFYLDGRADSIEVLVPGHVRGQLGADVEEVAARLAEDGRWRAHFQRSFGGVPSGERIATALADYVRTRYTPETPWDRYESGDAGAVSAAAVRGSRIFNDRAGCAVCHPPPLYTDLGVHPTAVPEGVGPPDPGRARLTGSDADRRAFKTPGLRGLERVAPYFHGGTAKTLEEALAVELGRVSAGLEESERADLLAFLAALSP